MTVSTAKQTYYTEQTRWPKEEKYELFAVTEEQPAVKTENVRAKYILTTRALHRA